MIRKKGEPDEYSRLIQTVKPVASRFLSEKFAHWKEVYSQETRKDVEDELIHDGRRSLYLRILAGTLSDPDMKQTTGFSFIERVPLIDTAGTASLVFDILLKGNDGKLLFCQFIPDQKLSFLRLKDLLGSRYDFLVDHREEIRKRYGNDEGENNEDGEGEIDVLLILPERPRKRILRSISIFNNRIQSNGIGPLRIIALLPGEGKIMGLPANCKDATRTGTNDHTLPEPLLLQRDTDDAGQNIYRLFELSIIEKYYGKMLNKGVEHPKVMKLKEMKTSIKDLLSGSPSPSSLSQEIIDMAERHNLIEAHPDIKGQYRLICSGTDLPLVQKNLTKKFVEGEAMLRAGHLARKQAVEEYRKRYPRIDGRY